ncbi:MAG TPA: signal peptidase I [Candidatus Paceibacterota bacterium]|nr:signal peptidase I [Candidatus Paceibacterota bacterium]HQB57268.1 signal peptidase I [Candidatus Paceibacterota bacterium]
MSSNFNALINNFLNDTLGNPYSLLLSIIIFIFFFLLLLASFSKKTRKSLVKLKLLEKNESPGKLLALLLAILIIIKMIQGFVVQPFLVDGGSMLPNLKSGELLIIDKLTFDIDNLKRGDVIVFRHSKNDKHNGKYFIKRLIGLPGDRVTVENGVTTIYNSKNPDGMILDESFVKYKDNVKNINITLQNGEYLAFGDNRAESYDSRSWGVIYKKDISGKAVFRLYPFNQIGANPGEVAINFINK